MAQSERVVTVDHDAGATADCGAVLLLAGARHRRCPASRVEVARLASPFPYHALGEEHAFFSLMVSLNASWGGRSLGAEGLTWPFSRGRRDFPSRRPEARVSGREREKCGRGRPLLMVRRAKDGIPRRWTEISSGISG